MSYCFLNWKLKSVRKRFSTSSVPSTPSKPASAPPQDRVKELWEQTSALKALLTVSPHAHHCSCIDQVCASGWLDPGWHQRRAVQRLSWQGRGPEGLLASGRGEAQQSSRLTSNFREIEKCERRCYIAEKIRETSPHPTNGPRSNKTSPSGLKSLTTSCN